MALFRPSFAIIFLICIGCSAQSVSSDVAKRIEREVRSYYSVPASVTISLSPLKASDFPNYDSLTITLEGSSKKLTYDFLLSKDDKQLMRITKLDLTSDPYAAVMKKIDVTGRPTRGNKDAKVVVVNFDDFECPFCSRMHATLFPEILKEYGDKVLFVYKDYPIQEIHPWATRAAIDANCLGVQNNDAYWDFADYIHGHQHDISAEKDQSAAVDRLVVTQGQLHHLDSDKLEACIKAQNDEAIKKSEHEGDSVGVSATPTMFINGQELDGALPISEVRAALDNALVQAGVTPPAHPSDKTALPSSAAPSTAPTAAAPTPGK